EVEVDVAVMGGGMTGLSTALALREQGLSVAVLERKFAGYGASGRNAGHVTPTIGKDFPTLKTLYGSERSTALVRLVSGAIEHVEEMIRKHAIDCAYEPVGNVLAAVHEKQYATLDAEARAASELGLEGDLLDAAEMRRRGLPRAFTRGYLERRGGILHPGRYVRGLKRATLRAGASLFENTPVIAIEEGRRIVLATPEGRVSSDHLVLATNAYTGETGFLKYKVLRLYVYLFQTEPLTESQRSAVGWRGREGIYTAHQILESYRLTDDDRIVGGAKIVRYGYGGRCVDDDPATFGRLEEAFRDRFPELRNIPIAARWGGPIGFTLDFLPAVGRTGKHRNIFYSVGYAGHGIPLASFAGSMIADLMLRRRGPGDALTSRRQIPLPPEPFRWLIFKTLTGIFESIDRRVDRTVRRRERPA
ncbi:MAG: NAD(P)/FAD-dependent oxidoreductase, partial [Vicinamibacteria bacterium]